MHLAKIRFRKLQHPPCSCDSCVSPPAHAGELLGEGCKSKPDSHSSDARPTEATQHQGPQAKQGRIHRLDKITSNTPARQRVRPEKPHSSKTHTAAEATAAKATLQQKPHSSKTHKAASKTTQQQKPHNRRSHVSTKTRQPQEPHSSKSCTATEAKQQQK